MTDDESKAEGQGERPRQYRSSGGGLPQDAVMHLMKSGTEFIMAMDALMPKNVMPTEAKQHYDNIKKETLLMFRSFIDAHLKDMEEKREAPSPHLRKIDLD